LDFQRAGYTWTKELCQLDSDKDGFKNGEELGDPYCIWKVGDIPTRTTNITHPGFPPNVTGPYDPDCLLDRSEGSHTLSLRYPNFSVPSESTSYFCNSFTLPADQIYYAIKYAPIIQHTHVVHHMILYACEAPPKQGMNECSRMPRGCGSILYAWAIGGGNFCLPMDVGIVFGKNQAVNVLLQIHYDNPNKLSNITDSSGVDIIYTSIPQSKPAGFMALGVKTKNIYIPEGKSNYELIGHCKQDQTKKLPYDIYTVAYALHMHRVGQKIWTTQYRDGKELTELGRNNFYDFNLQSFIKFDQPMLISKGDELTTHCVYNSSLMTSPVLGGESTTNEMCFNFLLYYPKIDRVFQCISNGASPTLIGLIVSILFLLI